MRLADELLLLAYVDEGSPEVDHTALDLSLAGAVLLELALGERLAVRDGLLEVTDATPTGDPVLDDALGRIAADEPAGTPPAWVAKLARDLRGRLLDGLVDAGILRRESGRVLGVFPQITYHAAQGVEPIEEVQARQRLIAALDGPDPVEPSVAALAALLTAANLTGRVLPGRRGDDVTERVAAMTGTALTDGGWAVAGVRAAIGAHPTPAGTAAPAGKAAPAGEAAPSRPGQARPAD